jgi:hypothetical protein
MGMFTVTAHNLKLFRKGFETENEAKPLPTTSHHWAGGAFTWRPCRR